MYLSVCLPLTHIIRLYETLVAEAGMGKYMKKAKITGDVTVMEFSQSSHGVRTRAKTLALQRLQKATLNLCETSYLQLRSRRLEKPQVPIDTRKQQEQQQEENPKESCTKNLNPSTSSLVNAGSALSVPIICSKVVGEEDVGIEASFGESNLALEGRERLISFAMFIPVGVLPHPL